MSSLGTEICIWIKCSALTKSPSPWPWSGALGLISHIGILPRHGRIIAAACRCRCPVILVTKLCLRLFLSLSIGPTLLSSPLLHPLVHCCSHLFFILSYTAAHIPSSFPLYYDSCHFITSPYLRGHMPVRTSYTHSRAGWFKLGFSESTDTIYTDTRNNLSTSIFEIRAAITKQAGPGCFHLMLVPTHNGLIWRPLWQHTFCLEIPLTLSYTVMPPRICPDGVSMPLNPSMQTIQ